jgi:hypothetical protein
MILTIAHIVGGLVIVLLARDRADSQLLTAIYLGLFLSQVSLLGFWGGLAPLGWPVRLTGVAIGIAYLGWQFCFNMGGWALGFLLFVFLSTIAVTGIMLVVRQCVARLDRTSKANTSADTEALRFSIRHLMLLTLVVSCTLAIGRWLLPYFPTFAFDLTVSLSFMSVAGTSVWAMLGKAHLVRRSCIVLVVGLPPACVPVFFLGDENNLWFWITILTVQTTVLLASLFVVRRCGFRLVRLSNENEERLRV